jgi:hypothetical protein
MLMYLIQKRPEFRLAAIAIRLSEAARQLKHGVADQRGLGESMSTG